MSFSRASLWRASLVCLVGIAACDKDPPTTPAEQPPPPTPKFVPPAESEIVSFLGLDAGEIALPPSDPPPSAGDLKAEADSFVDLETCVRQRARVDSVLGDAIDALGYETLLRDSCRVIEAVKTKSTTPCEPIVASSLRDRCALSVAVVTNDSLVCPMSGQNHDALCVALARKDPRLCVNVLPERRTMCRAMLAREPKKCGGDRRCERMVDRWKGLIEPMAAKPELGTTVRLEVTETVEGGKQKPKSIDLSQYVVPATVFKTLAGQRVMIGDPSTGAWPSLRLAQEPRLALTLLATAENIKQGDHQLNNDALALEMLIPKVGQLSSKQERSPATVVIDTVGLEVGAPIRFTLDVDLGDSANGFHVSLNVSTYVRDVVSVHPSPALPSRP